MDDITKTSGTPTPSIANSPIQTTPAAAQPEPPVEPVTDAAAAAELSKHYSEIMADLTKPLVPVTSQTTTSVGINPTPSVTSSQPAPVVTPQMPATPTPIIETPTIYTPTAQPPIVEKPIEEIKPNVPSVTPVIATPIPSPTVETPAESLTPAPSTPKTTTTPVLTPPLTSILGESSTTEK